MTRPVGRNPTTEEQEEEWQACRQDSSSLCTCTVTNFMYAVGWEVGAM